jgi:hypothetical protein
MRRKSPSRPTYGGVDHGGVSTHAAQRGGGALRIEIVEHLEQIRLAQDDEIAGAENDRVLGRLVIALGHAQQSDVTVLAEVEARGTDEIADIFDEQEIDRRERQLMQRLVDSLRIEMAGGARRDLHGRYAMGAYAHRIVVGSQVPLDHRDSNPALQRHDRRFEQGRLAGAGRGH